MRLSVSLVTYMQSPEELRPTLESITNSPLVERLQIIDNSPTNELQPFLSHFPCVEYLHNPSNPGFGASHNIALRRSLEENIPYHLIVNPDVSFDSSILDELLRYMDETHEAGLITPKILYPDGSLQYHCKLLPTPWDWFVRGFVPFATCKEWVNRRFELKNFGYDRVADIPYLNGSFMLFRTSALQVTGIFDERFFMYSEDTDLTRRIHSVYRTIFYPFVSITHTFNRESHRNPRLFLIQIYSTILYFSKWGWFTDEERKTINKTVLQTLFPAPAIPYGEDQEEVY